MTKGILRASQKATALLPKRTTHSCLFTPRTRISSICPSILSWWRRPWETESLGSSLWILIRTPIWYGNVFLLRKLIKDTRTYRLKLISNYVFRYSPRNEILPPPGENGKYFNSTENFLTKLVIDGVEMADAGNYSIVAISRTGIQKNLTLQLVVHGRPSVDLHLKYLYRFGVPVNVSCLVIGRPTPNISWFFKRCDDVTDLHCQFSITVST